MWVSILLISIMVIILSHILNYGISRLSSGINDTESETPSGTRKNNEPTESLEIQEKRRKDRSNRSRIHIKK